MRLLPLSCQCVCVCVCDSSRFIQYEVWVCDCSCFIHYEVCLCVCVCVREGKKLQEQGKRNRAFLLIG